MTLSRTLFSRELTSVLPYLIHSCKERRSPKKNNNQYKVYSLWKSAVSLIFVWDFSAANIYNKH